MFEWLVLIMHQSMYSFRSIFLIISHAFTILVKTILMILFAPFLWFAASILAVLNTIRFCCIAPFKDYLEPRRVQANQARTFEGWRAIQRQLDRTHEVQYWLDKDEDPCYDWRGLRNLKDNLAAARQRGGFRALDSHLRAQATRNCCSMLSSRLYRKSQVQTKKLIHDYIHEVRRCIERLLRPEDTAKPDPAYVDEEKRRCFSEVRQILGRTSLVLQGGAMFSMCHLGVVRALHRRRLLPRIITATGTGTLVAAIVGCTPDDKLLSALEGSSINIDAFISSRERRLNADTSRLSLTSWVRAAIRRTKRFVSTGHFFEIDVLAQCVRNNIGDVTFEEAFAMSGRILNITIAKPTVLGTPQLLNYITTPHVIVWSAVAASVATSKRMFAPITLKCKNDVGMIDRYFAVDATSSNSKSYISNPKIPMERIGELFDVNHYIVSQTRPYIVPFEQFKAFVSQDPILGAVIKVVYTEILHRLDMLNRMGYLPVYIQRVLIDEKIPSTSTWSRFVIVPNVSVLDYFRIFNFPSHRVIDTWAMKGERSVWPKISQIKSRCCVELELDAACHRDNVRFRAHPTNGH